jgi:hypothetical protein
MRPTPIGRSLAEPPRSVRFLVQVATLKSMSISIRPDGHFKAGHLVTRKPQL